MEKSVVCLIALSVMLLSIQGTALLFPSGEAHAASHMFVAAEDAYVDSSNGHNGSQLKISPNDVRVSYVKFDVSGLTSSVDTLKLQLRAIQQSGNPDMKVYLANSNNWTESTIDPSNAPSAGSLIGTYDAYVTAGTTIEVDLNSSTITADGTYTLIVKSTGVHLTFISGDASYAPQHHPRLLVDTSGGTGGTGGDSTAPAAIADLTSTHTTFDSVTLGWTNTGDDGTSGTAAYHDIRYSTSPITSSNWASATRVLGVFAPEPFDSGASDGNKDYFTVTGLDANTTYYLAMRSGDESGNESGLSNVIQMTTDGALTANACDFTLASGTRDLDGTQTSIPAGSIICLESGSRGQIQMSNLTGTPSQPITVVNFGGLVDVYNSSTNSGTAFRLFGSSHIRVAGTGDPNVEYGIKLDSASAQGFEAASLSTNIEVHQIEATGQDVFAGIMMKTDDKSSCSTQDFVQYRSSVHDNKLYGMKGEAIYLGSSGYDNQNSVGCYEHVLKGVRVFNNDIFNTGRDGLQVGSGTEDVEIFSNRIENTGIYPGIGNSHRHGIEINPGTVGKLYNNTIINAGFNGINMQGMGGMTVFNNLVDGAGGSGIYAFIKNRPGDPDDIGYYIVNNTFVDVTNHGLFMNAGSGEGHVFYNNIVVHPGENGTDKLYMYVSNGSLDFDASNNLLTDTLSSVGFADVANGDFHLTSGSSAVDAGWDVSGYGIDFDLDRSSRPNGTSYDIGAYEY